MVKTPDELFELWLEGELISGYTRKDFCYKHGLDIKDMRWAFCGGVSFSTFNRFANDVQ
jgi:hypothetical protein